MLRIVGDINLTDSDFNVGFGIGNKLANGFDPLADVIDDINVWIGNFEGVSSDISDNEGIYSNKFRVSPSLISHIKHCNYYGVANNHVMQHGRNAYNNTIKTIAANCDGYFGSNNQKTLFFEHQDKKISITGFSLRIEEFPFEPLYWHSPELFKIKGEIDSIEPDCFKIIYIHWGNEFVDRPSTEQKRLARWLVDVGFDLVVGMHPHVLQGFEIYKSKFIFYSIGNFVFDMAWEPTKFGAIVNVDFKDGHPIVTYNYIKIGNDYKPRVISEDKVPDRLRFNYLNNQLMVDLNPEVFNKLVVAAYKKYRRANRKNILLSLCNHPILGIEILKEFFNRKLFR